MRDRTIVEPGKEDDRVLAATTELRPGEEPHAVVIRRSRSCYGVHEGAPTVSIQPSELISRQAKALQLLSRRGAPMARPRAVSTFIQDAIHQVGRRHRVAQRMPSRQVRPKSAE